VRERAILYRAFTQEPADYLDATFIDEHQEHSLDSRGIPYSEFGVELSAPSRGVIVWAILREIGVDGMRERVHAFNGEFKLESGVNQGTSIEIVLPREPAA